METGVVVSLGMAQKDVVNLIGQGTYVKRESLLPDNFQPPYENVIDPNATVMTYTYGNAENLINIDYKDGIIKSMWTDSISEDYDLSNWYVKYGLTNGDTIEIVLDHYGKKSSDTTLSLAGINILSYDYDASGNPGNEKSASSTVTFSIKNNKVFCIEVSSV